MKFVYSGACLKLRGREITFGYRFDTKAGRNVWVGMGLRIHEDDEAGH